MLKLSDEETALLRGSRGRAVQFAMEVLVKMGQIQGAQRMVPITSAHVDGCAYEGDAIVDFVEFLAQADGHVAVPTTLNAISIERGSWRRLNIPEAFGEKAGRVVDGYLQMGCRPTFTCSPYQVGHTPALGEHVAWAESNAIAYANSILGARTDRYGDFLDISAALAGRVPEVGLHRTENRRARIVIQLGDDMDDAIRHHDAFYPLLGYWVGLEAGGRVPAIVGIPSDTSADRLKALLAASASSGAVALMHLVGLTPEAPTLDAALNGDPPDRVVEVTRAELRATFEELDGGYREAVHAVVLGSPHFSAEEFRELAVLVRGRSKHESLRFLITTNRTARDAARAQGTLSTVEAFGAEVIADTCILLAPLLGREVRTMMTNSGKYAHYSPGRLGVDVLFGSLKDCVETAVMGRLVREDLPW